MILFGAGPIYSYELLVSDSQGNPIDGAKISFQSDCDGASEGEVVTGKDGRAFFESCFQNANIVVSKAKFISNSNNITSDGAVKNISLSLVPVPPKTVNVIVTDSLGVLLAKASLSLICMKGNDLNTIEIGVNNQPEGGFDFNSPSSCTTIQLKATAQGYSEKIIRLDASDSKETIKLEKVVLKGTVIFSADSPVGVQRAEITLTNSKGQSQKVITSIEGYFTKELEADDYTFTAVARGAIETGSFSLNANQTQQVNIYFKNLTRAAIDLIETGGAKNIYLKIVDGNNPLSSSTARIFFSKNSDMNILMDLTATIDGVIGPKVILDENLSYFALIKMHGYETKIVQIELRIANLGPQLVQMKQGGAKLSIALIDDANTPIKQASVVLYKEGFGGIFGEQQVFNEEGIALFEDLPSSNFTVKATTDTDEGQMQVYIGSNDKNVTLMLLTGRGEMVFSFLNKSLKAIGTFEVEKKSNRSYENIYASTVTPAVLSDNIVFTKLRPISNDGNYIPYKGLSYEVTRTRQLHDVYLRKQSELPNTKETQVILKQAYSANPLYGRETTIKKFMPGVKTYLLFDLILNISGEIFGNANANFYIDSNYVKIQNAYSIDPSVLLMSEVTFSGPIPESFEGEVYSDAKQATIYFGNQSGQKMIPIILEVSVDENFDGEFNLNYNSNFIQNKSLDYSKAFTIGETFCIEDCPDLLFSNYLKRADKNYKPVYDGINTLLIDDNYTLKTTIQNISDKDFGQTNLIWWIGNNDTNYFAFFGNKAKSTRTITLAPFSSSGSKEEVIMPKKPTSAVKELYETVSADTTNVGVPRDSFLVAVRNKEILQIDLYATDTKNVLYEKAYYYSVFIKTKFATNQVTPAYWKIYLDGQESNPIQEGYTNEEGEQSTTLDLTNIAKEAKLILYAEDENGAVPARREIIVSSYFPEVPIIPAECLKVIVGGVQISGETQIEMDVNETIAFVIKSECTQQKVVTIQTDLDILNGKQITMQPNSQQNVTISPYAAVQLRNGLLGAYPLKVISNSSAQSTLATIDVIVSDTTSCFELTDAIFDFTQREKVSSSIINKCFEGRKDNFYPKMNILTNSVALAYKKPGNPEQISFTAHVIASGIESFVQSTIGSSILDLKQDGSDITATPIAGSQASALRCFDALIGNLDWLHYDGNYIPKPEPDLNITNPNMPLYRMPTPADWEMAAGPVEEKAQKVSFAVVNSDAFPYSVRTGDGGQLIPGTASLPVYWSDTFSGQNLTAEDINAMGLPESVASDWNKWYTDNNTCTARHCEQIYQDALAGIVSYMHNPPGYNRLYSSVPNTVAEYFGWPVYLWSNDAEGISASGSIGRIDLTMGKCENGRCGLVMGRCNGAYCMGNDGQYYNMGSPERWYLNAPTWISLVEQGGNCYNILYDHDCGDVNGSGYSDCMILDGGYLGSGRSYLKYYLQGEQPGTFWWQDGKTAELMTQFEWERGAEMANERKAYWSRDVNLPTIEGTVRRVGTYAGQVSPEMMWTSIDETSEGLQTGEGYALPLSYYTVGVIHPNGLVNPERTRYYNETSTAYGCVVGDTACEQNLGMFSFDNEATCRADPYQEFCRYVKWVIRPAADPLVEYDATGRIMYYIPQDTIPGYLQGFPTVRMFLKNGQVYAEYIGKPEINSPNIDFNLSKVNLYGEEYAIITIADWIDGERKEEKAFRVKLKGNPTSCYANDGTAGYSGQQFVPKVTFNWDWTQTGYNFCDVKNPDYTYCDATQFTTALFKRLKIIDGLKATGNDADIPKYSAFYAALIKDNYTQNFLLDYDDFYSSALINTSNFFNSTTSSRGYDQFITSTNSLGENRLQFKVRTDAGNVTDSGQLEKPGIYRVEINIVPDNSNVPQLMDNNSPNATIEVIFKFEQSPPNNNPLYYIPFDGEVGNKGGSYVRKNYGSSIVGELPLNDTFIAKQYNTSFTQLTTTKSDDLVLLNNKILLQADKSNIYFLPAQPTPLLLTVKGINGKGVAEYQLVGSGAISGLVNDWYLTNSSIYSGPRCYDFENKNQYIYSTLDEGMGKKLLSWNGTKDGTLGLQTVIMAPKNTVDTISLKLLTNPTKATIRSYDAITSASIVQLNNRQLDEYDYSTLKKMFDAVSRSDACISYNNENLIKIWWNPAHLQQLMDQVNNNPTHRCVTWSTT